MTGLKVTVMIGKVDAVVSIRNTIDPYNIMTVITPGSVTIPDKFGLRYIKITDVKGFSYAVRTSISLEEFQNIALTSNSFTRRAEGFKEAKAACVIVIPKEWHKYFTV